MGHGFPHYAQHIFVYNRHIVIDRMPEFTEAAAGIDGIGVNYVNARDIGRAVHRQMIICEICPSLGKKSRRMPVTNLPVLPSGRSIVINADKIAAPHTPRI